MDLFPWSQAAHFPPRDSRLSQFPGSGDSVAIKKGDGAREAELFGAAGQAAGSRREAPSCGRAALLPGACIHFQVGLMASRSDC